MINRCAYVLSHSFGVGSAATIPQSQSWFARFARVYPGKPLNDSEGGRSFFDVSNGTNYQALAQRIASFCPTEFIYDLNVNDWIKAQWNATDFGTLQGTFLDYLHGLCPWLKMYMAAGSPPAFGSTPNAAGSTMPNYNSSTSTAAGARSAFAQYVDTSVSPFPGASLVSPDGLHYSTDGQQQMGAAWLQTLGYVG